ncbi:MAG: hypothetical protein A4E57_04676 [Syntrophorhabdaceae bacterium PtaU1.Bin034]|nr:MAG: hypothetical protein A4E57_04676 [Syntrophorhabdaceae bacterium PtaU1.Bin034]
MFHENIGSIKDVHHAEFQFVCTPCPRAAMKNLRLSCVHDAVAREYAHAGIMVLKEAVSPEDFVKSRSLYEIAAK